MKNLFHYLGGAWHLQRQLGPWGTVQGVVHFRAWAPGVWHYKEQGWANWGRVRRVRVYRAYAYVYKEGTIAVHFWDEIAQKPAGLLHTLNFQEGVIPEAVGSHRCGEDTYEACYRFFQEDHFQLTYQVQGPRKDYVLQTQFWRMA